MIFLSELLSFLQEEEETPATRKAHQLGLVAKPYGHWADPKTGEVVARTLNGQLIKVDKTKNGTSKIQHQKQADPSKSVETPLSNLEKRAGGMSSGLRRALKRPDSAEGRWGETLNHADLIQGTIKYALEADDDYDRWEMIERLETLGILTPEETSELADLIEKARNSNNED